MRQQSTPTAAQFLTIKIYHCSNSLSHQYTESALDILCKEKKTSGSQLLYGCKLHEFVSCALKIFAVAKDFIDNIE